MVGGNNLHSISPFSPPALDNNNYKKIKYAGGERKDERNQEIFINFMFFSPNLQKSKEKERRT